MERLDELIEIVREMDKVKLVYASLEEQLEQIKTEMREQNDLNMEKAKNGGIKPDDPYPEYIDPQKITYLTIDGLCESDKLKLTAPPRCIKSDDFIDDLS